MRNYIYSAILILNVLIYVFFPVISNFITNSNSVFFDILFGISFFLFCFSIYKLLKFGFFLNKKNYKIFIVLIGSVITLILFDSYYRENIFLRLMISFSTCIFIFILFREYNIDRKNFRKSKNPLSFIFTFIGFFFILLNVFINNYFQNKRNKQNLIQVKGHINLMLKKDRTYVLRSLDKYFYGQYQLKDSIVYLDRGNFDDNLVSEKFVVRTTLDSLKKDIYPKKYLIQIDQNGNEIKNMFIGVTKNRDEIYDSDKYEIVVDNRNISKIKK